MIGQGLSREDLSHILRLDKYEAPPASTGFRSEPFNRFVYQGRFNNTGNVDCYKVGYLTHAPLRLSPTCLVRRLEYEGPHQTRDSEVMRALSEESPYIVGYYGTYLEKGSLYFLLENADGGSLDDLLKNSKIEPLLTKYFASQLWSALTFLHSKYCVYRALRAQNVMLTGSKNCRLTNFQSCLFVKREDVPKGISGVQGYVAPELAAGQKYTYAADWYSYGVLLKYMLTGTEPGENPTADGLLPLPMDLVEKLLRPNPLNRIRNDYDCRIIGHGFFDQVRGQFVVPCLSGHRNLWAGEHRDKCRKPFVRLDMKASDGCRLLHCHKDRDHYGVCGWDFATMENCPMSQQFACPCGRRTAEVDCTVIAQALRAQRTRRDVKKSRRPKKFDILKPQCRCKKICRCPDEDDCKCNNVCMCNVICKCRDACTCGGNCKCGSGCTCEVVCRCKDGCNCEDLCECDSICELTRALPDPTLLDLPAATSDQKKAVSEDEDVSGDEDMYVSGEDKDLPDCPKPKRLKKNAQGLKAQLKKEFGREYRKKWNGRKPDEKEPASGPQVDAPGTNDCTDLFDHHLASQDRPLEEWLEHL